MRDQYLGFLLKLLGYNLSEYSRGWESWEEAGSQELASEEIPENIFEIMRNGTLSQVNTQGSYMNPKTMHPRWRDSSSTTGRTTAWTRGTSMGIHLPIGWPSMGTLMSAGSFLLHTIDEPVHEYLPFHRYLMTKKVAKIDLHSNNGQGPRPIHWASR